MHAACLRFQCITPACQYHECKISFPPIHSAKCDVNKTFFQSFIPKLLMLAGDVVQRMKCTVACFTLTGYIYTFPPNTFNINMHVDKKVPSYTHLSRTAIALQLQCDGCKLACIENRTLDCSSVISLTDCTVSDLAADTHKKMNE